MTLRKLVYGLLVIIALFFFGCNLTYNIFIIESLWLRICSNIAIILDPVIVWILFSKQGSVLRKNLDKFFLRKASEEYLFETIFSLKPLQSIPFDSPKKDFNDFIEKSKEIKLKNDSSYDLIKGFEQKGSTLIITYDSVMKYPFDKFELGISLEEESSTSTYDQNII
ncbi:MAG: hypothetical protein GF308_00905 [Candidatus Heimdallarchaeota archaeon]|nr:hypothetical protein [Candidatus Heimdallarchaeota archaeon]